MPVLAIYSPWFRLINVGRIERSNGQQYLDSGGECKQVYISHFKDCATTHWRIKSLQGNSAIIQNRSAVELGWTEPNLGDRVLSRSETRYYIDTHNCDNEKGEFHLIYAPLAGSENRFLDVSIPDGSCTHDKIYFSKYNGVNDLLTKFVLEIV